MPINFNFKWVSDYFTPSSTKTQGAGGANTGQAGKSSASSSFSGLRNSAWARKCAAFDPVKLARTISSDPRTRKAVETAKSGLNALYKQMTVLVKNLRTELSSGSLYGGYRPSTEEQRINDQWRAFLPPGATFRPGSTIDPHSLVETVHWHKDGVQWTSTHDPATGERGSTTAWSAKDAKGWQSGQSIDHLTGTHWFASRNEAAGKHTSQTAWGPAEVPGGQTCKMFDHNTKTHWNAFHYPGDGTAGSAQSFCRTEWSEVGEDGVKSRQNLDQKTNTLWQERFNTETGEHVSTTGWHPDAAGKGMQRLVKDHQTGETYIEPEDATKTSDSYEYHDASFDMQGRTAAALANESLDILGLDRNETDKGKIKKQYYKLSKENHPDKANQNDAVALAAAKEAFQQLNSAYKFLTSDKFPVPKEQG